MAEYDEFLSSKLVRVEPSGFEVAREDVNAKLFPFQRDLTRWAVRKGRCAIFAETGLGKTFQQIEWARLVGGKGIIFAPLSVARQTIAEGAKIGVDVHMTRSGADLSDGLNIANYEMLHHFDPAAFRWVVLDESSLLKGLDGKTRQRLTEMFDQTPYRLCCTATPAPNDIAEIANHAEFLGIMTRAEMLASFFVHDDDGWRLKGHSTNAFYRWLASWGMSMRRPSDLGYSDDGYILPPLEIAPLIIPTDYAPPGKLFFTGLQGIQERHQVRRRTLADRVKAAAELIEAEPDRQWIAWCGLNDEGRELAAAIPGSVLVEGQQSAEDKAKAIEAFQDGKHRVLVTKGKIAGFGMNLQCATRQVFVGIGDSFETYYQCIRRSWRFGQQHPVKVHVVVSDMEQEIYQNVLRKEREAADMQEHLIAHVAQYEREEIENGQSNTFTYETAEVKEHDYRLLLGDSAERLKEIPEASVDLSVYSPPFMSLYTYSPTERDVGNSRTEAEFYEHFRFITSGLLRATKPGRITCCHVAQIPAMLVRDGYIGLKDFRGLTIRAFQDAGWIYHGEVCLDKDPQAQAIRTKSKGLLFTQMHKDSSWSRPALADFILLFRKPGENATPIRPDINNDEWIEWARPIWYGIRESDTLQYQTAREDADERHICPLQLGTIERCIRLWSNQGETVLDPFAGIGSTGYEAIRLGRKFVGVELKKSYFKSATENLRQAWQEANAQIKLEI